ncbi:hypothetical protein [Pseudomonas sp. N040]|uniref:hypothetical protein n=1 Tax=Pseudomonas sp. N040 TaxID=2785325 RepID=UPI0018A25641|nr:hypothetical protein [Pseudomonas sp. N040]MBF7729825.1 hypothetical protein [Pseudomonas sp. N040]MBW7013467.1 hypothetical protein [Pseudomonas sp. N040]
MQRSAKSLAQLSLVSCAAVFLLACATQHDDELQSTTVTSEVFLPGKPGSISTNVTTIEADVIKIDYSTREVTLQDEQGNKKTLHIDREATNFAQVKVGDHVVLQSAVEMAVFLPKDKSKAINAERSVALKAPQGEKPAFLVAETTETKAVITAIDLATRKASLTFEDGRVDSFVVRPDVQLSETMVGQSIVILMTNATALSVTSK